VIHDHFVETADKSEIKQTLIHELAHAIAEQNNKPNAKGKLKRVWHGQAWKDIMVALKADPERYHVGEYVKPTPPKRTMKELFAIKPKHPANRWEIGTFNQWLLRGYHVTKGNKGIFKTWDFIGDEYETKDGETSQFGRASAVYFDHTQVAPNK